MEYHYLSDYDNFSFKKAFCHYFKEMGIDLTPDNEVFATIK